MAGVNATAWDAVAVREALLERRADRARELMHAAEVILLGHDDAETITVTWQPRRFAALPGVRRTPPTETGPPHV